MDDAATARGTMPRLGQGTWEMGRDPAARGAEVAALRLGLDLGLTLIDTAEMYDEAEVVVGEAIRGRRDEVFLVSKVYPWNASRRGVVEACERSLRRLGTDRLDLYLLHWPGEHPLRDTFAGFEQLVARGLVGAVGVSNFDVHDLVAADAARGDLPLATNQILYNLVRRRVERRVLPACRSRSLRVMAYSPLEQARLDVRPGLRKVADRHGATPEQIALAWVLRSPDIVVIPKAVRPEHVRANAAAGAIRLSEADLAELDRDYPVPGGDGPLECL